MCVIYDSVIKEYAIILKSNKATKPQGVQLSGNMGQVKYILLLALIGCLSSFNTYRPLLLASIASADLFLADNFVNSRIQQRSPNIKIMGGWKDTQKVSWEKVYIGAHVTDDGKITKLSFKVKNQNSDEIETPIARPQSQMITFGRFVELQKGKNIISIEASDEDNNSVRKDICFIKVDTAPLMRERLSISIDIFEQNNKFSKTNIDFQRYLSDAFFQQKRFRVFDKNTRCNIVGTITENRFSGIEIVGRMIDTETSETLAMTDVYSLSKDHSTLRSIAWEMASKFELELPLLAGKILFIKDNYFFTDIIHDKLNPPRRLIIFREDKLLDPDTGQEFGIDYKIVGYAQITEVLEKVSKAKILNILNNDLTSINKSDKVITQ